MATQLRRWILAVGVTCTLFAMWLSPPQATPIGRSMFGPRRVQTPERMLEQDLRTQVSQANDVLQRARLADSLSAYVAATDPSVGPVVISLPPEVDPDERARVQRLVARELDSIGSPYPDMRIGIVLVERYYGNHPLYPTHRFGSATEYMAGVVGDRPFCILVRAHIEAGGERSPELHAKLVTDAAGQFGRGRPFSRGPYIARDILGPCGFHLAYGPPGPEIGQWLRNEEMYRLAQDRFAEQRVGATNEHRGMFGRWARETPTLGSAAGEGCLAGKVDACRASLTLGPAYGDSQPLLAVEDWIHTEWGWHQPIRETFAGHETFWMGDLEAEFGTQRFEEFWTSDQSVDEAFLAAFGEPIEEWTMRWAQGLLGQQRAGPSTSPRSILLTIVTLLACAGITAATGTRRRI